MKHHLSNALFAGLVVAMAVAQPAAAAVCLSVHNIKSSDPSKDGSAINFRMVDGKVWRNDLKSRCPDLKYNGFSWRLQTDQVCDNDPASLRVIQSGEICQLGKFTQVTPAPKG